MGNLGDVHETSLTFCNFHKRTKRFNTCDLAFYDTTYLNRQIATLLLSTEKIVNIIAFRMPITPAKKNNLIFPTVFWYSVDISPTILGIRR
jgi:hypothetical protein